MDDTLSDGDPRSSTTARGEPVQPGACPKCRRPRRDEETACARCGLLASNFGAYTASQDGDPRAPAIDALWSRCRAGWTDAATHDRLIDQATALGALPSIARLYRSVLDGESDEEARRRLLQIAVLIEAAVRGEARERTDKPSRAVLWIAGYLVAAAVLALSIWVFSIALSHS